MKSFCLSYILAFFPGSHVLLSKLEKGRVIKIISQGNTTGSSKGSYWPASTIKLLPAIAVMRSKVSLKTIVKMRGYRGSIRKLLKLSLVSSSNTAYDKLVDIVGLDYVNTTAKKLGLKHTWLRWPYGRRGSLRYSPGYYLGKKYIKPKRAKLRHSYCRSNCTSLEELQKLLLEATKYQELRRLTHRSKGSLYKSINKYFPSTKVYCKAGYVKRRHGLENCRFGKYFVTVAMPSRGYKSYKKDKERRIRVVEILLSTLTRSTR